MSPTLFGANNYFLNNLNGAKFGLISVTEILNELNNYWERKTRNADSKKETSTKLCITLKA